MKGIRRSNSFLVEIIIVILFFSLSAAVTLQVFVATHKKEQQSGSLNHAVVLTQQLTEEYRANGTACSWCATSKDKDGSAVYVLEYDENWQPVQENGAFRVYFTVSVLSEGKAGTGYQTVAEAVTVKENGEESVYRLTSQQYMAKV